MLFLDDGDDVLIRIDRLGCSLHSNEYDDAKSNLSTANRSTIFEVIMFRHLIRVICFAGSSSRSVHSAVNVKG